MPVRQHISAEAPTEKMHYKTEIQRKFVYASAEIQNHKQMLKILFPVSQHISAEALVEKMHYAIRTGAEPLSFLRVAIWRLRLRRC